MCRIIDQLAIEKDIALAEANYIYVGIISAMITKVPALKQVIEDIFEDAHEDRLKEHIGKMASIIQEQQWKEKFKNCMMLPQSEISIPTEGGSLF